MKLVYLLGLTVLCISCTKEAHVENENTTDHMHLIEMNELDFYTPSQVPIEQL
ncbi:MAG: hypothetical protein ACI9GM_001722 [Salibacteraceae bacterium]|jgi:hypothetical protein